MLMLKYYSNLSTSRKAAIWYVVCNILQKGIAFLIIPVYVRLLTASEYGQYTIFQSWCNILIVFATLNLYCGVFTKAMVDYPEDRDRYTSSMQGLSSLITFCMFVLNLFLQQWWYSYLEMDFTTTCLMFVYFLSFPAFSFWAVRQRVEHKYRNMVIVTFLHSVAIPLISLMLLLNTDYRANAVIWGFLIAQILFGMAFYVWQFIKGRCVYDKDYWIHAVKFNIPLVPHYLSLIVLGQIDRILIGYYCGKDKAGIYSLAYQVSMIVNVILSGINGSFVPWIYQRFKMQDFDSVKGQSKRLCKFVIAMTILVMLVTPEIIWVMGTDEYYAAIWIIPAVCISVYFQFCYGLFACVEFYYNATKYVMVSTTTGACLSFLMNLLLLPRFGYLSAGYVSLTCYGAFMLMHYMFMQKIAKQQMIGMNIFDIKFIGMSCVLLLGVMFICLILYAFPFIRYSIILMIIAITYAYRNQIKTIIKTDYA